MKIRSCSLQECQNRPSRLEVRSLKVRLVKDKKGSSLHSNLTSEWLGRFLRSGNKELRLFNLRVFVTYFFEIALMPEIPELD